MVIDCSMVDNYLVVDSYWAEDSHFALVEDSYLVVVKSNYLTGYKMVSSCMQMVAHYFGYSSSNQEGPDLLVK